MLNQFSGKTQHFRYLMQLFAEHNAKIKALGGNGFEANTLRGHDISEKHLKGYLLSQFGQIDIEIGHKPSARGQSNG